MTKRILVIEDVEDNPRILRDLLTAAGYELLKAVDGDAGVAMAAHCKPESPSDYSRLYRALQGY